MNQRIYKNLENIKIRFGSIVVVKDKRYNINHVKNESIEIVIYFTYVLLEKIQKYNFAKYIKAHITNRYINIKIDIKTAY